MIKKLKPDHYVGLTGYPETRMPDSAKLMQKINELVDAVNEILDYAPLEMAMKTEPADPYAKQRKWIGCLVEYGNADDGFRYGILTNIEPLYSAYPFEIDNGRNATADCWLPSKTIFYKGGDND